MSLPPFRAPHTDTAANHHAHHDTHTHQGRHTGQQPTAAPLAGPVVDEGAELRSAAIWRLRKMNLLHAQLAWERRRRNQLAPYGLAYLFAYPDPQRGGRRSIAAATRLWKAGPESQHVDRLLFAFHEHVCGLESQASQALGQRQGPLDIRHALANRADQMPEAAAYTGIALSTLDTHTGSWHEVLHTADSEAEIPGRILMVMSGQSVTERALIVCERRSLHEFNAFQVHCTHNMELLPDRYTIPSAWATPDELRNDPHNAVLRFLEPLHETLCRVDNTRLAYQPSSSPGSRPNGSGGGSTGGPRHSGNPGGHPGGGYGR
ncbi:MAG TPA: hypothetical protein VFC19_46040 [Candidatus Limnocylindrales bacterium]|nr:hypothetical protein [Candidatus Limnocylindrales bacterium]